MGDQRTPIVNAISTTGTAITGTVEVLVDERPVTGTVTLGATGIFTWTPNANDPPLAPGTYTVSVQFHVTDALSVTLAAYSIKVEPAPLSTTLFEATDQRQGLRTAPVPMVTVYVPVDEAKRLIPPDTRVDLLGRKDVDGATFVKVRSSQHRGPWWIWLPSRTSLSWSPPNGSATLMEITQAQVDQLPAIP
jgi:hypothetical protein